METNTQAVTLAETLFQSVVVVKTSVSVERITVTVSGNYKTSGTIETNSAAYVANQDGQGNIGLISAIIVGASIFAVLGFFVARSRRNTGNSGALQGGVSTGFSFAVKNPLFNPSSKTLDNPIYERKASRASFFDNFMRSKAAQQKYSSDNGAVAASLDKNGRLFKSTDALKSMLADRGLNKSTTLSLDVERFSSELGGRAVDAKPSSNMLDSTSKLSTSRRDPLQLYQSLSKNFYSTSLKSFKVSESEVDVESGKSK
jgi:hypothetical protein